jgi:hypothetical protein
MYITPLKAVEFITMSPLATFLAELIAPYLPPTGSLAEDLSM